MSEALQHNLPIYSVSEIAGAVKKVVEGSFTRVRVRGEISGLARPGSGHVYMSLKDDNGLINAVCWRGTASRLSIQPQDGMEVICTGKITTYPSRSQYQLVIDSMEIAGEGALLKLLEDRRKKLAAEGLFDAERKRALPSLPACIGVVTSPTGAVIRDIIHRIEDRHPTQILVWPTLVQGEGAAEKIAAAINGFNQIPAGGDIPRPDVLIVARGGGSLEDLWAFNEEVVVRAAAASTIPLISAVGHETDTTLIDYVSDQRAPTPTAAAEMAVPVRRAVLEFLLELEGRQRRGLQQRIDHWDRDVSQCARALTDVRTYVDRSAQRLDDWVERFGLSLRRYGDAKSQQLQHAARALRPPQVQVQRATDKLAQEWRTLHRTAPHILQRRQDQLHAAARLLDSLSHHKVLARGFALVFNEAGQPLTTAAMAAQEEKVAVQFADGRLTMHPDITRDSTPSTEGTS